MAQPNLRDVDLYFRVVEVVRQLDARISGADGDRLAALEVAATDARSLALSLAQVISPVFAERIHDPPRPADRVD